MADVWRSARLIYRAVRDDDEEFLADINSDSATVMNVEHFLLSPHSSKRITSFRELIQDNPNSHLGAVVCLDPEQTHEESDSMTTSNDGSSATKLKPTPIGVVSLFGGGPLSLAHHRHSEVGLRFLKSYQNRGYGTEALEWLINWGFRHANLHRINIGAFSHNKRAIRVYEKVGFVQEGVRREMFWSDGSWTNLIEFGMLEHEWRERSCERSMQ